ncbi:A disintegrin and metalloproteinase with thrombospondin motifs 9-like [Haliotis cracherodii]|uniref:A disintegrin and metalloproteinase with thrombospondin motifs 9-like n=1 Tax=Haliotis cracherodii TaxID=6455 RepID=UPI0039E91A3E
MGIWQCFIISVICYTTNALNFCSDIGNINAVRKNTALLGSTFLTLQRTGIIDCAKQCLLRRRCKSFNVALDRSECQLNEMSTSGSVTSNIVGVENTVVSDIDQWPGRVIGACQNHTCPDTSVCRIHKIGSTSCSVECSDPLSLANGAFSPNTTGYDVGATLSYSCADGYLKSGEAVCQSNGTWSDYSCEIGCQGLPTIANSIMGSTDSIDQWPVGSSPDITCSPTEGQIGKVTCLADRTWSSMKCVRMQRSCSEVRDCNWQYGDGEFWLFPQIFHNVPVKIFCSGMKSGILRHYVTLPRETFSDYTDTRCRNDMFESCVSLRYDKIRIDNIDTMTTELDGLRDDSFANGSKCGVSEYAGAFDCSLDPSCEGRKGRQFKVDTGLTGLVISPETQWFIHDGKGNVKIERSDNNRIINGECVTDCTYCYPGNDEIKYVLDNFYSPNSSSATIPICLSP